VRGWVVMMALWGGAALAAAPPPVTSGFREPRVSPDGKAVAFVCGGDLWIASIGGGGGGGDGLGGGAAAVSARPLTRTPEDERSPVWLADGDRLAFAREDGGDFDLFVLRIDSGETRQLTWHEGDDRPTSCGPDGEEILFTTTRERDEPRSWKVAVSGGEPRPITFDLARDASLSRDGSRLLLVTGLLPHWQRGYRGAGDTDVAILDLETRELTRLTEFDGPDHSPLWGRDEESVLYISEESIVPNLWRFDLETRTHHRVTDHTDAPVRWPSLPRDGRRVVYEQGGAIWILELTSDRPAPRRLELRATLPPEVASADTLRSGLRALAVSSRGQVVVEAAGDLFALDLSALEPAREPILGRPLAPHPYRERDPVFSPDGAALCFVSDRSGDEDLLRLPWPSGWPSAWSSEDSAQAVPVVFRTGTDDQRLPRYSGDGRLVAYVRRREREELLVADASGGRERVVADAARFHGFDLSPDGDWIAYAAADDRGRGEIYLRSLLVGDAFSFTDPLAHDIEPHWTRDGRALVYLSDAEGSLDLWGANLLGATVDAASGAASRPLAESRGIAIERAGLELRRERLTDFPGDEGPFELAWGGVLCGATLSGERALWWIDPERLAPVRLTEGDIDLCAIAADGNNTAYALDRQGRLHTGTREVGSWRSIAVALPRRVDPRAEREQLFAEAWRSLRDGFHDRDLHLLDWRAARKRYEPRLDAIGTRAGLSDLLADLVGELGASHVGDILPGPSRRSGELGLAFAQRRGQRGTTRRAHALSGGPMAELLARRGVSGESVWIESVDGVTLGARRALESILDGRARGPVEVVWSTGGEARRDTIVALDVETMRQRARAERDAVRVRRTASSSQNRARYVALARLGPRSRFALERALDGAPGLVVDLRGNAGGSVDLGLLDLLARVPVARVRSRGGAPAMAPAPSRLGPLALLVDERTASAAEILAHGVRTLDLGALVGETTAGGVLGTDEIELMDGSGWRIPRTEWTRLQGSALEWRGLAPDVQVSTPYESLVGRDELLGVSAPRPEADQEDAALDEAVREVLRRQKSPR